MSERSEGPSRGARQVPDGCGLDDEGAVDRVAEWRELAERSQRSQRSGVAVEGGAELLFGVDAEPELRRLVALEETCCAHLGFDVRRAGEDVVLTVTGPPAEVAPFLS